MREDLREPKPLFSELRQVGCEYVVLAWLDPIDRGSVDIVRNVAKDMNRAAAVARSSGLRFGYHNHAFEFEQLGDTTIFNQLAEALDPELVFFELDVYWLTYAGLDPAAELERWRGRVPLVHMKDMGRDEGRSFAAVGTGLLNWPQILTAARAAECDWYIVEQDVSAQPLADLAISHAYLRDVID
jgi:sugar phosphate isomerase/epimerase